MNKIAVIIPNYNGFIYSERCFRALENQTFKDFEVCVIDDCSTDGTCSLVESFIENNGLHHWRLVKNSENKGWRRNFMEGLLEGSGDLLFPCDQDDIWEKNKIEVMERILQEQPQIHVLVSGYEAFYDSGKTVIRPKPADGRLTWLKPVQKLFNIRFPGCTYCVRRDFLHGIRKYWQEDFPHDAFLWRMAMFSDSLYLIRTPLIRWRRHRESTYTQESVNNKTIEKKQQWIEHAKRNICCLQKYLQEEGMNSAQKQQILTHSEQWLECRENLYTNGNLLRGASLFRYIRCYSKPRQYIGDLYLVFAERSKYIRI